MTYFRSNFLKLRVDLKRNDWSEYRNEKMDFINRIDSSINVLLDRMRKQKGNFYIS